MVDDQVSGEGSHSTEDDRSFADWVAEIVDRIDAGESVDLEAYAVAHPEQTERLRGLVSAMGCLDRHGVLSGSGVGCDVDPMADGVGTLGDFRTVRVLGRGGMGVVYEAVQVSLNRRVALKILPAGSAADSRRLRRFQVEAQAAACLHHAHIVPVFLVGSEGGVHY